MSRLATAGTRPNPDAELGNTGLAAVFNFSAQQYDYAPFQSPTYQVRALKQQACLARNVVGACVVWCFPGLDKSKASGCMSTAQAAGISLNGDPGIQINS